MKLRSITDINELESIKVQWEKLQYHPNTDFDHFKLICSIRKEVISPYVIIIEDDDNVIISILACRLEKTQLSPQIGYFKPFSIPAKILYVLNNGLMGVNNDEIAEALIRQLHIVFKHGTADAIHLNHFHEKCPFFNLILKDKKFQKRMTEPIWKIHWALTLDSTPGFLLNQMKAKHRGYIRNREKKISKELNGINWRWIKEFSDLPGLLCKIEQVAAQTYHRGLGVGFKNDQEHYRRFRYFADTGGLRVKVLETENSIKAFWIGIIYKDTYFSTETGYEPSISNYSPGTLIFIRMCDDLVHEGVKILDFGLGDAEYKQRFGDSSWNEGSLYIFSPKFKGIMLKCVVTLLGAIDKSARKILLKTKFFNQIKTAWRKSLISKNQNPE